MDDYINKIAEIRQLEIQYVEDYKSIYNKLSVNDFFNTKKLYVIIDDIEFTKEEKAWQDINTNGNILIFKYNNELDKRSKFYKQFEDKIIEFNKLLDEILTKYIRFEIPLSNNYCKELIDICNSDYSKILLEINKIYRYFCRQDYPEKYNIDDTYLQLKEQGAFNQEITDITFEFIEKVITRQEKESLDLYNKLKQNGESNIKLLSLLYNNFRTILLIQSCKSNNIEKTTGLTNGQIYYNKDKLGYYTIGELVRALKLIQKTEEGIKTGKIDEPISIDYILVNII